MRKQVPCIVRFKTKEQQQVILNNGHLMFDNKPVIVKEWNDEIKLVKYDVETVPIWAKLHDLEVNFWSEASLTKICTNIGKYVKSDQITQQRTYLSYARVMLEVQVGRDFPKSIGFIDEKGNSHRVLVSYD